MKKIHLFAFFACLLSSVHTYSHPVEDASAETEFVGPTETKGVAGIESRGVIELEGEFASMKGKQMRAREFTIEPGGVVGVHTHNNRPGYAYILEGNIVEHRNDTEGPILHQPGSVAIEKNGVAHWWENTSDKNVKALVVDIYTPVEK